MGSSFHPEISVYSVGVVEIVLHDWAEGTQLYTTAGKTRSADEAAAHHGPVVYDGHFREFVADGSIVSYHPHAGYCSGWSPGDTLDRPATLLSRLESGGEARAE